MDNPIDDDRAETVADEDNESVAPHIKSTEPQASFEIAKESQEDVDEGAESFSSGGSSYRTANEFNEDMARDPNSNSMKAVHEIDKERNGLYDLAIQARIRHLTKDMSSESSDGSLSERASHEDVREEARKSKESGFQHDIEPNEDSIAPDQCASGEAPKETASSFSPWTTSYSKEAWRYLNSFSCRDVALGAKPDGTDLPWQSIAKEEDDDDSEEDPIIRRIPKAYRVPRGPKQVARQYVVPEQVDESHPPPILPHVLRTMRLLEADYALFRELEVRGSKSCPEHCPPKGEEAFCFCIQAYENANLEDHILTKLDFVME